MNLFIRTSFTYYVAFYCAAFLGNHFLNHGFGRSDLGPLMIWGLPGILLSSFVIGKIAKNLPHLGEPVSFVVRIFVALVCAVITTAIYPVVLGAWFGAMSISPLLPNLAGALSATVLAPKFFSDGRSRVVRASVTFLIIVLVCSIGVPIGISLLKSKIFKGGKVLTSSIAITPSAGPLDVQKLIASYCSSHQFNQAEWDHAAGPFSGGYLLKEPCSTAALKTLVQFHQALQVTSQGPLYSISGRLAQYEETNSAVIFAFKSELHFPKEGVEFALPDQTSVIYYQTDKGWEMFPKNAKTLDRKIKMINDYQESGEDSVNPILCLSVEDVDGHADGPECANVLPDGVKLIIDEPE